MFNNLAYISNISTCKLNACDHIIILANESTAFAGDSTEEILAADAKYSDHPLCENIADSRVRGEAIYANSAYSFRSVLLVAPANYYFKLRLSLNSCDLAGRNYPRDSDA